MSSLTQLVIVHNATIHVNLHNLVTLSQVLPRLEILRFRIANHSVSRPLLEVSALLGIIPLFPLLTRFETFMDTSAQTFPEVAPSMKFQHLTSLGLGLHKRTNQIFTIVNPLGLAAFLDSILPDTCQLDPESSRNRSWASVCTTLETLRAGRIPSQE
ncbi:hypothetical protein ONZ45_g8781 [Pleurotus djamor]|nr:hypothetical protein ONZ45_g8781 [Pleurotus djamor]